MSLSEIRVEDEVFVTEGAVGIGAVREVGRKHLTIHVEGYGELQIGPEHIASAHDGKVILNPETLPDDLRHRLDHLHDGEYRRPSQT